MRKAYLLSFFLFFLASPLLGAEAVRPLFLYFNSQKAETAFYFSIENGSGARPDRLMLLQINDGGQTRYWAMLIEKVPKKGSYYKMKLPLQLLGGGRLLVTASLYDVKQRRVFHVSPRYLVNTGRFDARGEEDAIFGMGDEEYHEILVANLDNEIPSDLDLNPSQSLDPDEEKPLYFKILEKEVPFKLFSIASTTPVNLAEQVSRNPLVSVRFTEKLEAASVKPNSLTLFRRLPSGQLKQVIGRQILKDNDLSFQAEENLWPSARYTAKLLPGLRSVSGEKLDSLFEWSFDTLKGEAKAPPMLVMAVFPKEGETRVGIRRPISVNFDQVVDPNWQEFDRFRLIPLTPPEPESETEGVEGASVEPLEGEAQETGSQEAESQETGSQEVAQTEPLQEPAMDQTATEEPAMDQPAMKTDAPSPQTDGATEPPLPPGIPGRVQVKGQSLVFFPSEPLAYGTQYRAVLQKGLPSLEGHLLRSQVDWTFITMEKPQLTGQPLSIQSVSPVHRAERVEVTQSVEVIFEEELMPQSIDEESLVVMLGGDRIEGRIEVKGAKLSFQPKDLFKNGETYRVTLSEAITGRRGNPMAEGARWYFTTKPYLPFPNALDAGIEIDSDSHDQISWAQGEDGEFDLVVTSEVPLKHLDVNGRKLMALGKLKHEESLPFVIEGKELKLEVTAYTERGKSQKTYLLHPNPQPLEEADFLLTLRLGSLKTNNLTRASLSAPEERIEAGKNYLSLHPKWYFASSKTSAWTLDFDLYVDDVDQENQGVHSLASLQMRLGFLNKDTDWGEQSFHLGARGINNDALEEGSPKNELLREGFVTWEIRKALKGGGWRKIRLKYNEQNIREESALIADEVLDELLDATEASLEVIFGNETKGLLVEAGFGGAERRTKSLYGSTQTSLGELYLAYPMGAFVPSLRYRMSYVENLEPDPTTGELHKRVKNLARLKLAWQTGHSSELALIGLYEGQSGNQEAYRYARGWAGMQYSHVF